MVLIFDLRTLQQYCGGNRRNQTQFHQSEKLYSLFYTNYFIFLKDAVNFDSGLLLSFNQFQVHIGQDNLTNALHQCARARSEWLVNDIRGELKPARLGELEASI